MTAADSTTAGVAFSDRRVRKPAAPGLIIQLHQSSWHVRQPLG